MADIKASEAVETGAGRQADCVFKAVAPERITAAAGREQANPVVYEISGTDTASAGMLDIYAEENSRITVVERFTKKSPEEKNLAFRTRMIAAKNSKIRLVQVIALGEEQTLLSDTGCVCDENAQVELLQLFIGKGHVYNGVRTDLKGERADFPGADRLSCAEYPAFGYKLYCKSHRQEDNQQCDGRRHVKRCRTQSIPRFD